MAITIVEKKACPLVEGGYQDVVEFRGSSNDVKPTKGIGTGSLFLEIDTGDIYIFSGSAWTEL